MSALERGHRPVPLHPNPDLRRRGHLIPPQNPLSAHEVATVVASFRS